MKHKKKTVGILLAVVLSFALAACGNSQEKEPENLQNGVVDSDTEQEEEKTQADSTNSEEAKILVAYFSQTGTTEEIAQTIAEETGGDLAEIERAEAYEDLQEEAEAEIQNGERPEITVSVEDVSSYDTVFVGYPIWYDEAPAMIATFLAEHDFSGKTVIPFCTSANDSIDNSLHIFEELCPDADIREGLTANDTTEVEPWLLRLGVISE